MGIRDTLASFIDNTGLADKFKTKPHDPAKARKPLLDGIERTRDQFSKRETAPAKGPKWWKVQNGVVALTVKVNGDTFDINGVATNHMPEERFEEFLTKFEQAVKDGEFDAELQNKGNGNAKVRIGKARSGASSKRAAGERHPSNDRKDWDNLSRGEKQKISAFYRFGKNPDGSLISEAGYKPDAALAS